MNRPNNLHFAALSYLAACAAERDVQSLRNANVTTVQGHRLFALGCPGLWTLAMSAECAQAINIAIDQEALGKQLDILALSHADGPADREQSRGATKDGQLTLAVLNHLHVLVAAHDIIALKNTGLTYDQAQMIGRFGAFPEHRLSLQNIHGHCLTITMIDPRSFEAAIAATEQHQLLESEKVECIRADASREMMQYHYGMGRRDYQGYRAFLGLGPAPSGRYPVLDDTTRAGLQQRWHKLVQTRGTVRFTPNDYLALHRDTGLPLRIVWALFQEWSAYAPPPRGVRPSGPRHSAVRG